MPRAKKHVKTGFFVGLLIGGIISILNQLSDAPFQNDNKVDWSEVIGWGFIGGLISGFCSLLPDILEPAYSPNHRGFFHSFTILGLLAVALFKVEQMVNIDFARKSLTFCAIMGYGSHLVLDSKTPAGLHLI